MTIKQKRFADEYIITGNATQSYKTAGYRANNDKQASAEGIRLLQHPKVAKYIGQRLAELRDESIADQREVLEYLTAVMRREKPEHQVVTMMEEDSTWEPDEGGTMRKLVKRRERAQVVEYPAKLSDANKAAELLAKRYGLLIDRQELNGNVINVVIEDDTEPRQEDKEKEE